MEEPLPDKPKKDGHFDNIHDALTYGLVNEVPMEDKVMPALPPRVEWVNRQRIETPYEQGDVGWRETKHGW